MSTAALFLIDGVEETEAVTVIDILRRGRVQLTTVSLSGRDLVQGKHDIFIKADVLFEAVKNLAFDLLILPGGTLAYNDHEGALKMLRRQNEENKKLAAICAAPAVFGKLGFLKGKNAVCYPGLESWLEGATVKNTPVETDGQITTSKGPATAMPFALRLLEELEGRDAAARVREDLLA